MTVPGQCHCHSVRLLIDALPGCLVACDCSLCTRRGALWAHYPEGQVTVQGYTEEYAWGERTITFHHCPKCGCTTHWRSNGRVSGRVGVNARLIDGFHEEGGARTSTYRFGDQQVDVTISHGANG